jgi:hypothetical protein
MQAEECLKRERERVSHYLHSSSETKLVEVSSLHITCTGLLVSYAFILFLFAWKYVFAHLPCLFMPHVKQIYLFCFDYMVCFLVAISWLYSKRKLSNKYSSHLVFCSCICLFSTSGEDSWAVSGHLAIDSLPWCYYLTISNVFYDYIVD